MRVHLQASLRLNIAQPALSLHIRDMEVDLGTPLLFRNPHGVQPTEAGTILFRNALAILDQLELARQEIKGSAAEPSGEVRVGLPSSISQVLGVPLILAARRQVPKVTLRVAEAMSGYVLDRLRQGRVDLGLLYQPVDDRGLRSAALLSEMLVLFGPVEAPPGAAFPPEGPVPFARCADLPLILPSSGHGLRDLVDEAAVAQGVRVVPGIGIDAQDRGPEEGGRGPTHSRAPPSQVPEQPARWRPRPAQAAEPADAGFRSDAHRAGEHTVAWGSGRVRSVERAFRSAVRKAGLEKVTLRVLRRTAATWMAQAGVPPLGDRRVPRPLGRTHGAETYGRHHPNHIGRAAAALA